MRKHWLWAAAAILVPTAALAGHGKVGLWQSTTTMTMNGTPPQTHSSTFCMTQAQVLSDAPQGGNPGCTYQNMHADAHTVTADMVCHGQLEATGHFSTTYDSDTHYLAKFSIVTGGMTMNNSVEGTWLKADCAGAMH